MAAKIQNDHQKEGDAIYLDNKTEINKWGVNSGVSGVTETDAGYGMLLGSSFSKMAAKKGYFLYLTVKIGN